MSEKITEKESLYQSLEEMSVMASPQQMLVRGDYRHEDDQDDGTVHLCDFKPATVFRSIRFPQPIDVNSVDVAYQDGILRIMAAKEGAGQARPKRTIARRAPAKRKRAS